MIANYSTICALQELAVPIVCSSIFLLAVSSAMKPSFEKLVPASGDSFRCFDRSTLLSPVKWHRHPEIEITYIEKGSGSRLVGDSIASYTDHDLVLLGSELPHTWASDEYRGKRYDRHRAIVLQFHPEFLGSGFFSIAELHLVSTLLDRARRGIWFPPRIAKGVGKRMVDIVDMTGAARLIQWLTCLHELAQADAGEPLSSDSYSLDFHPDRETRIQNVCDLIARRFTDPELTHRSIAKTVHMNPSAFSRFFRQSTGRTVTQHIAELRVGLACRKLVECDDSILRISLDAGFMNLSNFNRRFRELRGTTPRDFRSQYRLNE